LRRILQMCSNRLTKMKEFMLLFVIELTITSLAETTDNFAPANGERDLQGILPHGISDCSASFIEASLNTHMRTPADLSIYEPNLQVYCSNGGFCKAMYRDDPYNPCQCLEGFSGPHCEFVGSDVAKSLSCTLNCENDGVCRIGASTWENLLQYNYDSTPPEQRQYCSCPSGYFGTLCEHSSLDHSKTEKCGDQPCLNGGVCIDVVGEDGDKTRQCDCSDAKLDGIHYAGQFCEHNATDVCSEGQYGDQVFCVNGGTCKSDA
jgi:hypothetical protein